MRVRNFARPLIFSPKAIALMPVHRIRFRGGWELQVGETSSKISLPLPREFERSGLIRLVRDFGRPTREDPSESLKLEFVSVPGLVRAQLNEIELGPFEDGRAIGKVSLDRPLLSRNRLVLEVDTARASAENWGSIALVIESGTSSGR